MVCEKCEAKLESVACPEVWKEGARTERKINENKLLSKSKKKFSPYPDRSTTCKDCKKSLSKPGMYCQTCAYKKGLCSMCGVQILDTTGYRQRLK